MRKGRLVVLLMLLMPCPLCRYGRSMHIQLPPPPPSSLRHGNEVHAPAGDPEPILCDAAIWMRLFVFGFETNESVNVCSGAQCKTEINTKQRLRALRRARAVLVPRGRVNTGKQRSTQYDTGMFPLPSSRANLAQLLTTHHLPSPKLNSMGSVYILAPLHCPSQKRAHHHGSRCHQHSAAPQPKKA